MRIIVGTPETRIVLGTIVSAPRPVAGEPTVDLEPPTELLVICALGDSAEEGARS